MGEREELVEALKIARAATLNRGPDHHLHWKTKWITYKVAMKDLHKYDEKVKAISTRDTKVHAEK